MYVHTIDDPPMGTIEDSIEVLAAELGAIAAQIEDDGPDAAEVWIAEHHNEQHVRELLIVSVIACMEVKREVSCG
jgi:hypothetical protein